MLQGIEGQAIENQGRRVAQSQQKIRGVSFRKRIVVGNLQGGLMQKLIGGKFRTIDEAAPKRKNPFFEWRSSKSRKECCRSKKIASAQSGADGCISSKRQASLQDNNQIISQHDKVRFEYLIEALSCLKKGKQLRDIRPLKQHRYSQHHAISRIAYNASISPDLTSSPQTINHSVDLLAKNQRSSREAKSNLRQRMFQSQKRHYDKFRNKSLKNAEMMVNILGEEELKINKVALGTRPSFKEEA